MKTLAVVLLLVIGLSGSTIAQIRTEGTKTSRDSTTGVVTTTTYVEERQEEDITPRHNMITINPLKFFLFYNLNYYHSIGKNMALGGGLQMPTISEISGFGANLEFRFYPSNHSLRGFYVAPNVSYNSMSDGGFDATVSTVGVLLGWQWFPGDDFAMGLGIGVDEYFLSGSEDVFSGYHGLAPALRFDIGYAWK
jgi:hypothetical protein